jgi:hypothetical protein
MRKNEVAKTPKEIDLLSVFKNKESSAFPFRPSNAFYRELGISKKRFAMICKNFSITTHEEMIKVSAYLNISINDLIQPKQ